MRSTKERRMGLVAGTVAALGMLMVSATPVVAQSIDVQAVRSAAAAVNAAVVPYAVGEELTYKASLGGISAGTARMRVDGIEIIRGRPAYHVVERVMRRQETRRVEAQTGGSAPTPSRTRPGRAARATAG